LAHQPQGRVVGGLAQQCAQKGIVLEGGHEAGQDAKPAF
jgi:hypothetical protein